MPNVLVVRSAECLSRGILHLCRVNNMSIFSSNSVLSPYAFDINSSDTVKSGPIPVRELKSPNNIKKFVLSQSS